MLRVRFIPVKVDVSLVTETKLKLAPVTLKPTAPVVSTLVRPAPSVAPVPTNRLAPLIVKVSTFAPSIVPAVAPRPVIAALPVTTSAVAISIAKPVITATTLPGPMLSDAEPLAASCCALSIASTGIRFVSVEGTVVALSQSIRGPFSTLVVFSFTVPVTCRSTAATPISAAFVIVA